MSTQTTVLIPLDQRPLHERVAATVRAEMARYGITQVRMAELLGITQQSISRKRSGKTPYTLNELEIIAPLFGMTPDELLRGSRSPRPVGPDEGLDLRARRDSNPQPSDPKADGSLDEVAAQRAKRERAMPVEPDELEEVA